ncbi:hypothetical protein ACS0TY_026740 [Phlomoides rotata]
MGSKAKILVSLNLLLYVLSPTGSDTTNSTSPVAPCPNNSSSTSGLTPPPSGGGTNVAPCPYNSSNVAPCPRDALKLGICVNLVGKTVAAEVGKPATIPCCTVLAGLADLEVAIVLSKLMLPFN